MFVQIFDSTLANWVGEQPGLCTLNSYCGHAAVMEYNGDVYSCDHFVFPEYKLGNIRTDSLADMMYGQRQQAFGAMKYKGQDQRNMANGMDRTRSKQSYRKNKDHARSPWNRP